MRHAWGARLVSMARHADEQDPTARALEPDPVVEAYKKDIDRTLLRENLKRTVAERLENLLALQRFAEEVRQAGARARKRP